MVATTGVAWIWLLLLGGGGMPIPFSLPPLPEDPVMSSVAPEECLWYLTWAGSAKPDAASKNKTEQLLAEEEIQRFGSELEHRVVAAIREHAQGPAAIAAQEVPKLVKVALTRPAAVFIGDLKFKPPFNGPPDIHGGLIINLGDQADDVKGSLDRLAALLPQPAEAGKWQRIPSSGARDPVVEWGIDGKYLIVGLGEGSADAIVAREKGTPPKWLTTVRERLKVERPAMVHYLNIKTIMQIVQEVGGGRGMSGQILDPLGLNNLTSLSSVSGLDGDGWASNSLLAMDGPPSGIFALSGGNPLSAESLAPIPKDATFALAGRLDLDRAYRGISEIVGKVDPRARQMMEQGLAMVENHLGVDLSRDIFKALGDTWCVYSAPSEGGLLVTGLTVVVPLRDRERFVKAEARLRGLVQAAMSPPGAVHAYGGPPQATIADFEFRGNQIHFVNFVGEPVPVAPAWCITDKELIVSLSPQTLKAHLSRKADAGSLADVPAIKALFSESKGPQYVGYADTASIAQTLYPLVQFGFEAISSAVQREGIPIDMSIFPSAAAIVPHLEPAISSARMTNDGLLMTRRGTLPMEFETSLPLVVMPWMFVARSAEMRVHAVERAQPAAVPAVPRAN